MKALFSGFTLQFNALSKQCIKTMLKRTAGVEEESNHFSPFIPKLDIANQFVFLSKHY